MKNRSTSGVPEKFLRVWFMPWAGFNSELQLGPITFWPFSAMAERKVPEKSVREHLERYFRCYVDHQGHPADTVTLCSQGSVDFRKLRPSEASDIRAAVDALIFSIICPAAKSAVCANNKTMGPPSADRYQLLKQNFCTGDDHIAVRAGSLLNSGWRIGEITFPQPWCMGGAFGSPNLELVQGFSKTFEKGFPIDVRERLFRSLEWFRLAHTEADEVSPLSKVVMMATAFEITLQVPNIPDKKGWIANRLENMCATSESAKETRKDVKGRDHIRSKIAWWAWDFYELRNAVVHGDTIAPERLKYQVPGRDWLTHLIVADLVFWEYVARELYAHGCIGDDVRALATKWDKAFPNEPSGTSEPLLAQWFLGFKDVHRALGWLPELRRQP